MLNYIRFGVHFRVTGATKHRVIRSRRSISKLPGTYHGQLPILLAISKYYWDICLALFLVIPKICHQTCKPFDDTSKCSTEAPFVSSFSHLSHISCSNDFAGFTWLYILQSLSLSFCNPSMLNMCWWSSLTLQAVLTSLKPKKS